MTVDIEGFRDAVGERIKLQPCFDDHHATDGYRFQPIEFLRGVFANWWQQGADSVATFNWGNAPPNLAKETLQRWGLSSFNEAPASHREAYLEVGDPETMVGKDKVFAVERRGGYPWAEGYFNHNRDALLPLSLRYDGTPTALSVRVSDDLANTSATVLLRVVLFGAREGDQLTASLNGVALEATCTDFGWKDAQIFSPAPQPVSGGTGRYDVDPKQELLRVDLDVPVEACQHGVNDVCIAIRHRAPYCCRGIVIEKVELHIR
jgi:hypothetical protein